MTTDQYQIEWLLDSDDDLSNQERIELIEELEDEIGVEGEIEYGGEVKRHSFEPSPTSILTVVTSIDVLISIYQIIQDRRDSEVGIRRVNNEMFYVDEVAAETIESHNGDIIANIEGDVHFHTLPDDMDNRIELIQQLRENEDERN